MPAKTANAAKVAKMGIFVDNRVSLDPVPLIKGKKAVVRYRGLLSASGADQVYLYSGYGEDQWNEVTDLPMSHDGHSWVAEFPIVGEDKFNFCFHDSAQNWDNNSGLNWASEIL